jgi:diadenosine tetraphosphatase ApaH/serine/threonine PP2A family protein phosphatase
MGHDSRAIAVISDLHGNLEALQAVLQEIHRIGYPEVICLGDIVGYGPDPEACVDLVMRECSMALCGNHDFALFREVREFNPAAQTSIEGFRRRLRPRLVGGRARAARWEFLRNLKREYRRGDLLFVHASPTDPIREYLLKTDLIFDREKVARAFEKVESACFVGHTHYPGVMTQSFRFLTPAELGGSYLLGQEKAIINVGSVGQPRDGDNRASFAGIEGDRLVFHRVPYDFRTTQEKIRKLPFLSDYFAERLATGT